jgi:succinate dehydrogenase / fumarate reductase cytochrome b subunit
MPVKWPVPFWQNGLAMQSPVQARPLSPHLQVYRPLYTMVLSILHRASGLFLSACSLLLVYWLVAAALGTDAYAAVARVFASLPLRILLALALAAYWYHFFAGMRHLAWDAGYGFEKREARRSGRIVVLLAAVAFGLTLLLTPAGRWLAGFE